MNEITSLLHHRPRGKIHINKCSRLTISFREGELWDPFADPNIEWKEVFRKGSAQPFLEEIKLVPKTGIWPFIRQGDYLCCFLTGKESSCYPPRPPNKPANRIIIQRTEKQWEVNSFYNKMLEPIIHILTIPLLAVL